jgi:hypothetical protein
VKYNNVAMQHPTVAQMDDGNVLFCSRDSDGFYDPEPFAFVFNPRQSPVVYRELNPEDVKRRRLCQANSSLVALSGGRALHIGSFRTAPPIPPNVIYFLDSDTYKELPIGPREWFAQSFCVALDDSNVLISGGQAALLRNNDLPNGVGNETGKGCFVYNIEELTLTRVGDMEFGRYIHRGCVLRDGNVFVCGGLVNYEVSQECELYDAKTRTWKKLPRMMYPRRGHVCVLLDDGRIFIAGGIVYHNSQENTGKECEIYDIRLGRSTRAADMPTIVDAFGVFTI